MGAESPVLLQCYMNFLHKFRSFKLVTTQSENVGLISSCILYSLTLFQDINPVGCIIV